MVVLMKKILTIVIVAALAFFFFIKDKDARKEADPLYSEAKAAIVLEADTGKILYEQNAKEALPIASMSKLMTQYIVLEAIADGRLSWDSPIQAVQSSVESIQTRSHFRDGQAENI